MCPDTWRIYKCSLSHQTPYLAFIDVSWVMRFYYDGCKMVTFLLGIVLWEGVFSLSLSIQPSIHLSVCSSIHPSTHYHWSISRLSCSLICDIFIPNYQTIFITNFLMSGRASLLINLLFQNCPDYSVHVFFQVNL